VSLPTISNDGTTSTFSITSTATATSPTTGALRVAGGAGIAGNLYVGGVVTATNVYVNGQPVLPTNIQNFTAAQNTTTFAINGGYTVGYVQVFANGLLLSPGDYTASNGTTVILSAARNSGDQITVISNPNAILSAPSSPNSFSIAMGVALGI
jgi:hypothetical protein